MAKCGSWPIGVCSWSLQTDIPGVAGVMKDLRIDHVHLNLMPYAIDGSAEYLDQAGEQDWTISSTMIGFPQEDYSSLEAIKISGGIAPDDCWERNREIALSAVEATAKLGVKFLSTHVGFIDESQPEYAAKFYDRIKLIADAAGEKGVVLLMETGQETAEDLKEFLEKLNHPAVAVNFDPANMILYDKGDPIEAVNVLAPWVKHVHVKDATRTETPGQWGSEVVWGSGQVQTEKFLTALKEIGFDGALGIEREAGESRIEDIGTAVEQLVKFQG